MFLTTLFKDQKLNPTGHRLIKWLVLAALLAGVFIAVLLGLKKQTNTLRYSKVMPTKVVSTSKGTIEFAKPQELKATLASNANSPIQIYRQDKKMNGKAYSEANLLTASAPLMPKDLLYISNFNSYFKEAVTTTQYKMASAPITGFTKYMLPNYSNITLGRAAPFKNPHISKNAWIFNVTASGSKSGEPDQMGRAIYAWTNNAAYFYILTVANDNWQLNISTWNSMLNSINLQF